MRSKLDVRIVVVLVCVLAAVPALAQPLGTAFTYQGRLTDGGSPATGAYDLQLALYDAAAGGAQVGPILARDDVAVTNGLFTVSLDFGGVFAGSQRWLEIRVRPGASTGAYSTLSPRQELAPSPNAVFSATVPWAGITAKPAGFADGIDNDVLGGLSCASGQIAKWNGASWACAADADSGGDITAVGAGTGLTGGGTSGAVSLAVDATLVQSRVSSTCAAGSSIRVVNQDGTVVCEADTTGADWGLTGNAGTNPATHFIGTTDNVPLELRVDNQRALRLEQVTTIVGSITYVGANVLGGSLNNSITSGVTLATIAGGGGTLFGGYPYPNTVTDVGGTVGGGWGNTAGDNAQTLDNSSGATVAGGYGNTASGNASAVAGGWFNTASGDASVVAGGENTASGHYSAVAGGYFNTAGGDYSFAAGANARVRDAAASGDANGDEGTFAWADSQGATFTSTGPNQFLVRAAGGVGINTNAPTGELQLGQASDTTAFRFGNASARHHLISNRDMVFNGFDTDGVPNGGALFLWRRSTTKFDENFPFDLMTLADNGDLNIMGTLSKGGGSFKIDHPLDPENKYLYHSFVESPDMKNIYDGVVLTDEGGFATVELPTWFQALNRDFRYQLTVVEEGDTAEFVHAKVVGGGVRDNRFEIRTSAPQTTVSWQITGIRKDAFAEKHRIPIEQDKPEAERGRCLHLEACGGPEEKGIDYQERTSHARPAQEPPAEPEPAETRRPGARR